MLYHQYAIGAQEKQSGPQASQICAQELEGYLAPFSERLDAYVNRRIVGNLTAAVAGIVQTRGELTLSELGSTIISPEHAEAGTQRLKRVLHHPGWQAAHLEQVQWEQAERLRQEMALQGETPLCIWESSVLEKSEALKLEGLGLVRSSKARRLQRNRPGVFNRPGPPIMLHGFEWEAMVLAGMRGVPQGVAMRYWGREKGVAGQREQVQEALLRKAAGLWGRKVRHVLDRGFGNGPWLGRLWRADVRFAVRCTRGRKLLDANGQECKAWQIARGKRAWGKAKLVWDPHSHVYRRTTVLALPVRHPDYDGRLWLVVVRQGRGGELWYVLTNEPVENEEQAWEIAFSYVRRWQIEEVYRFQKCEVQIETVRLQDWEPRRKFLLLVTLAYGYLLYLLGPPRQPLWRWLLGHWCQRADWRLREAKVPLYRLRWALSRLWICHPPSFHWCWPYRPCKRPTWPVGSLPWWMTFWNQQESLKCPF